MTDASHCHVSPPPVLDFMKNVCEMSEPQKIVQLDKCWKRKKCKSQVSIEQEREGVLLMIGFQNGTLFDCL
jgi:hypothetical protein